MNTKNRLFYVYVLILIVLITSLTGFSVMPRPAQALADQALFTGRFDFSNISKVVFSNNGCSIKANFNGTGISITLGSETGSSATQSSFMYVIVDGNVTPANHATIQVSAASATFVLASGLPAGNHTVELVKETEYDTRVAFYGFTVTGGTLSAKPARPSIRLEFYGDSNAAGASYSMITCPWIASDRPER